MKYCNLAGSDIAISQIVLGCWALGGGYTWGEQEDYESIRTIHKALELGVNTFDTAEFYGEGRSEEVLGKALVGRRTKAQIMSKIWTANMNREGVMKACEGSLKRLDTDYIDIYMIHWPNREVKLEETLEAMTRLKEDGKIRALGVCNFGVQDLSDALAMVDLAADQLPYSLLFRAIEYTVLPECKRRGIPVLAYSGLAQGLLTGKFKSPADVDDERARLRFYSKDRSGTVHNEDGYEDLLFETLDKLRSLCLKAEVSMAHAAVNWILSKPGIGAVMVGARTPEQVEENLGCLTHQVDQDLIVEFDDATQRLKKAMGSNPDMWRTESRYR